MDLQLRGKRALVTGSTAGIWFAAAAGLYREGTSVIVNGRTPQRVEKAVQKIKALPTIGTPGESSVAGPRPTGSPARRAETGGAHSPFSRPAFQAANALTILATTGGEQCSPFVSHCSMRSMIMCVASEWRSLVSASDEKRQEPAAHVRPADELGEFVPFGFLALTQPSGMDPDPSGDSLIPSLRRE